MSNRIKENRRPPKARTGSKGSPNEGSAINSVVVLHFRDGSSRRGFFYSLGSDMSTELEPIPFYDRSGVKLVHDHLTDPSTKYFAFLVPEEKIPIAADCPHSETVKKFPFYFR
jgi:hypothetical protein